MAYGTVKVDNITFTNGGVDQTVTVSGIVQSISGNITATGTIQAATIIGTSTVSGATVTGNAGVFTTVTGGSAGFTTVTGTTVTGTTANFATLSGTTITGSIGNFGSGSAAAPSVSVGTTDNGIYSPGADQVAISTNGTGRLFIDSSGNIKLTSSQYQTLAHKLYGYGGGYGAIVVGNPNSNVGGVALAVDISGISGGNFNGQNQVVFPVNGGLVPNNAGTNFVGVFSRDASDSLIIGPGTVGGITSGPMTLTSTSVGLGTSSPSNVLEVSSASNSYIRSTTTTNSVSSIFGAYTNSVDIGSTSSHTLNFYTAGINRATLDTSGRLGVGTTSPSQLFHLAANNCNLYLQPVSNAEARIQAEGGTAGTGTAITFHNYNGFTNGERARIDSSGRLGIGTSSPQAIIHSTPAAVNGGLSTAFIATQGGSGANTGTALRVGYSFADGAYSEIAGAYESPGTYLDLKTSTDNSTAASTKLRITAAGKVGIGATTVQSRLHVAKSGAEGYEFYPGDSSNINVTLHYNRSGSAWVSNAQSAASHVFQIQGTEAARIDSSSRLLVGTSSAPSSGLIQAVNTAGAELTLARDDASVVAGNQLGRISWFGNDGGTYEECGRITCEADLDHAAGDKPSRLVFSTTADGASSPTERARIDSSGRLLVGTSSSTGSISNTAPVIAGLFQSFDDVATFTTGVAQTLFAIPNTNATYIVTLRRGSVGDAANYEAVSILSTNAGGSVSAVLTDLKTAANVSISISGTNLQGTQTSGGNASLRWIVTRVG